MSQKTVPTELAMLDLPLTAPFCEVQWLANFFRENTLLPVQEQHMAGVSDPVQPFFTNLRFSLLCKMFNSLDHQVELYDKEITL